MSDGLLCMNSEHISILMNHQHMLFQDFCAGFITGLFFPTSIGLKKLKRLLNTPRNAGVSTGILLKKGRKLRKYIPLLQLEQIFPGVSIRLDYQKSVIKGSAQTRMLLKFSIGSCEHNHETNEMNFPLMDRLPCLNLYAHMCNY